MRKNYRTITPYLVCQNASYAIKFYTKHFGAKELYRLDAADGEIMHSEIEFSDCRIMMSDEFTEMDIKSPKTIGGTPVSMNIYVQNVDEVFSGLINDGCEELSPVKTQFHGDRSGKLKDPFGHIWHVASNLEDISPNEIVKRFRAMMND